MFEGLRITWNADRRRCAGFHTQQQCVIGIVAVHLLVAYLRKGILESQRHMLGQELMQRGIHYSRMI